MGARIKDKQEYRQAVSQYLAAKAKGDRHTGWTQSAVSASRLANKLLGYAFEMQRAGKCTVAEAVAALPTYGLQCRMADNYIGKPEWADALKAIELDEDYGK